MIRIFFLTVIVASLLMIRISVYPQTKKITDEDIILDDDPLYKLKKNTGPEEKVREEYEDTEFELRKQDVLKRKQNLNYEYDNDTLQKFDSDKFPGNLKGKRKNRVYVVGGTGRFSGGGFEYGKDFIPSSENDGYIFSGLNLKFKTENFDYVQYGRKRISDSQRKFYDLGINSFTLITGRSKIINKISIRSIDTGLQGKTLYDSQERISGTLNTLFEFDQTKDIRHKVSFGFMNIGFDNNNAALKSYGAYRDKTSDLQKFDLGYENSFRLFPFLQLKGSLDYGQSVNKSTIYTKVNSNSVKSVNEEIRFRAGAEKPAESEVLQNFTIRAFLDFHHFRRQQNFTGGELFFSYKWRDLELGVIHTQRGYVLNYSEYYIQNDLGDLVIDVKRTKETRKYSFIRYQAAESISGNLKAGNSSDYDRYVWSKGTDGLYLPVRRNLHYKFANLDLRFSFLRFFEAGIESEYRSYDEKKTPYLPDYVQSLYGNFHYGKYKFDLRSVYRGSRHTDTGNKTLPKDHRFDATFQYAWKEFLELKVEIRNILGKELYYREDFLQPGRQILFGMGMTF